MSTKPCRSDEDRHGTLGPETTQHKVACVARCGAYAFDTSPDSRPEQRVMVLVETLQLARLRL